MSFHLTEERRSWNYTSNCVLRIKSLSRICHKNENVRNLNGKTWMEKLFLDESNVLTVTKKAEIIFILSYLYRTKKRATQERVFTTPCGDPCVKFPKRQHEGRSPNELSFVNVIGDVDDEKLLFRFFSVHFLFKDNMINNKIFISSDDGQSTCILSSLHR